eukprot:5216920-Alexandrium_andersonii.AAC.1
MLQAKRSAVAAAKGRYQVPQRGHANLYPPAIRVCAQSVFRPAKAQGGYRQMKNSSNPSLI